jgi:hypothetical protein
MLPGSILKNLLLGAQHSTYCVLPTHEEAWRVAKMCGLEAEFLWAPDSFNVGKGGRNLPVSARQCICLARSILSDPSVLLLHKPVSLLSVEKATRVLTTLKMYVEYGGLHGMLSQKKRFHSEAPTAYVIGNGTRQAPIAKILPPIRFYLNIHGSLPAPPCPTRALSYHTRVLPCPKTCNSSGPLYSPGFRKRWRLTS